MNIQKIKSKLIEKAEKKGIYENFGQKEVRELKDKYLSKLEPYSKDWMRACLEIDSFNNWAMNYTGR